MILLIYNKLLLKGKKKYRYVPYVYANRIINFVI